MLNAGVEWGVPRGLINEAVKKIGALKIAGLTESKDIVVFLRKAILVKLDLSIFSLYSYAILAYLQVKTWQSPAQIADDFAKDIVLSNQVKYASKTGTSILDSIIYSLSRIKVDKRSSDLSRQNIETTRSNLRKGGVVIVGEHKTLSGGAIGGALTRPMLYLGYGLFLHAKAEGVVTDSLEYIFGKYDTMAIIRPQKRLNSVKIDQIVASAKSHHGKPYDTDMTDGLEKLYCTELILDAYKSAGIKELSIKENLLN